MANIVETLMFKFLGDTSDYDEAADRVVSSLDTIGKTSIVIGGAMTAFFTGIVAGITAAAIAAEISEEAMVDFFGSAEKGKEMKELFEDIRKEGALTEESLNDLRNEGVLSIDDIAEHYGITAEAAEDMVKRGDVSFDALQKILSDTGQEGKDLATALGSSAGTLMGMLTDLKNEFVALTAELGQAFIPMMKEVVQWLTEWVKWLREMPEWAKQAIAWTAAFGVALGVLITTFGVLTLQLAQVVSALAVLGVEAWTVSGALTAMGGSAALAALALKGLAVAGVAVLAFLAGKMISDWIRSEDIKQLEEATAKFKELGSAIQQSRDALNNEFLDEALATEGPEARMKALTDEAKRAEQEIKGIKRQLKFDQDEQDSFFFFQTGDKAVIQERIDETNTSLQHMKDHLGDVKSEIEDLGEEMGAVGPFPSAEAVENAEEYLASLKEQVATIGMTADEAKQWKLEQEGISDVLREQIRFEQESLQIEKDKIDAAKELEEAKKKQLRLEQKAIDQQVRDAEKAIKAGQRLREKAAQDAFEKEKKRIMTLNDIENRLKTHFADKPFDITAEGLNFGEIGQMELPEDPQDEVAENTRRTAVAAEASLAVLKNKQAVIFRKVNKI